MIMANGETATKRRFGFPQIKSLISIFNINLFYYITISLLLTVKNKRETPAAVAGHKNPDENKFGYGWWSIAYGMGNF